MKEVSYTIEPKPINLQIDGNITICLGETVNILVNASFTDNFLWFYDINEINPINPNWLTTLNGSELEFTPTNLGVQRLYYKAVNNSGCSSSLNIVEINVNQKPTQLNITNNNTSFCSNEVAVFEASAFNVEYFEWWKNSDLNLPLEVDFITGARKNKFTIDTSILGEGEYIYYLVGVNSSGCKTEPLLLNFTINQIPLTPSVSGDPFVCIGENLEMTVISDGATSYKWYYDNEKNFPVNPFFVIGNGSSIRIPATTEQQGTIYVEGINENDCTTELINFNYQFNNAPLNLNVAPYTQTVCLGSEIKIEAGADNATEFLWWKDSLGTIPLEEDRINGSSNNTVQFISDSSDIGITSYFVQAKNVSGCTTSLEEVEFEVLALPEIVEFTSSSTDFQFLFGEQIIFYFNAENYTKHRILKDGIEIKEWTNGTIDSYVLTSSANGDEDGVYTLETSNGYCNTTESITIYVFDVALEIMHDKMNNIVIVDGFERLKINEGEEITFTSNFISDNYTYDWTFGDGFFNTEQISKHYYNIEGTYTVSLTLTNINTNAKHTLELMQKVLVEPSNNEVDINAFEVLEDSEISFAPNPFKNKLSLRVNNLQKNTEITIRIYNVSGINAFVETFSAYAGDNIFTWNNPLGGSPQGVYIVRLTMGEDLKTFKLIKEQ